MASLSFWRFLTTKVCYDYISDFYPEVSEFALSGGVFLDRGYGHFAICLAYGDDLGLRDQLVGVTHEYDFPDGVQSLPPVTHS